MSAPCLIPVAAADALAWASGRLTDSELLLHAPLVPEALFVVDLPDRRAYRPLLRAIAHWRARGAVTVVFRTNGVVADHAHKYGFTVTHAPRGYLGQCRFIADPPTFEKFCARFTRENSP